MKSKAHSFAWLYCYTYIFWYGNDIFFLRIYPLLGFSIQLVWRWTTYVCFVGCLFGCKHLDSCNAFTYNLYSYNGSNIGTFTDRNSFPHAVFNNLYSLHYSLHSHQSSGYVCKYASFSLSVCVLRVYVDFSVSLSL